MEHIDLFSIPISIGITLIPAIAYHRLVKHYVPDFITREPKSFMLNVVLLASAGSIASWPITDYIMQSIHNQGF